MDPTTSLDFRDRVGLFARAEAASFDVVVVGAGITGAGIARDAALRGLSVALVEAEDIASGTSSRSSKMIHGGLRYLAQGDVGVVREAARERQVLRAIAPHLTRYSEFMLPGGKAFLAKMRAGLVAFERLGRVPRKERHRVLDHEEVAAREPALAEGKFAGAVVYPEFLTNDARLTLANVRSAAAAGATVLTRAPVFGIVSEGGRAVGVECRGSLPGESLGAVLRGRAIVNAAGPWVDAVRALEEDSAAPKLTLTKGIHVVVAHDRLPVNHPVVTMSADKRAVFAVPLYGFTYVGTTDTFYADAEVWPGIEHSDVDYLRDVMGDVFAGAPIADDDIVALWAGVRPLVSQKGKSPSEISRKDEVWIGPAGVRSIAGGKLTAYRTMAERVVDSVVADLGIAARRCVTAQEPLVGGDGVPSELRAMIESRVGAGAERLVDLYGSEAPAVAAAGAGVGAEAAHAVEHEGALTLEDFWVRRSARAWFGEDPSGADLEAAADALASALGWDPQRRDAELAHVRAVDAASRACLTPEGTPAA